MSANATVSAVGTATIAQATETRLAMPSASANGNGNVTVIAAIGTDPRETETANEKGSGSGSGSGSVKRSCENANAPENVTGEAALENASASAMIESAPVEAHKQVEMPHLFAILAKMVAEVSPIHPSPHAAIANHSSSPAIETRPQLHPPPLALPLASAAAEVLTRSTFAAAPSCNGSAPWWIVSEVRLPRPQAPLPP